MLALFFELSAHIHMKTAPRWGIGAWMAVAICFVCNSPFAYSQPAVPTAPPLRALAEVGRHSTASPAAPLEVSQRLQSVQQALAQELAAREALQRQLVEEKQKLLDLRRAWDAQVQEFYQRMQMLERALAPPESAE